MYDSYPFEEEIAATIAAVRGGANPNRLQRTYNNEVTTPLCLVAEWGQVDDVRFLVEHGAFIDGVPGHGGNPLVIALIRHRPAVVRALLEMGAHPQGSVSGPEAPYEPALFWPCELFKGQPELDRLLLDFGADPNVRGKNNETPLMRAVLFGDLEIATMLVASGADTELRDDNGFTALASAAHAPHPNDKMLNVARVLLEYGAIVDCQVGRNQFTPLMLCCLQSSAGPFLFPFVELLVEFGADVNARGTQGQTPLLVACRSGYAYVVRLLLAHGADPNARDNEGNNPARFAEKHPSVRAVLTEADGK